jgi:hypothetical protein
MTLRGERAVHHVHPGVDQGGVVDGGRDAEDVAEQAGGQQRAQAGGGAG